VAVLFSNEFLYNILFSVYKV